MSKIKSILSIGLIFVFFNISVLYAYKEPVKDAAGLVTLAGPPFSGKCVHVADGDTITVLRSGLPVIIRLFGVDCPEKSQRFGPEAKQFTTDLLKDRMVHVQPRRYDNYGRIIASVSFEGENLSYRLIKAGLGWHYTRYSQSRQLAQAQKSARDSKTGLWSLPNPQPPWNYRHNSKEENRKVMEEEAALDDLDTPVYVTKNGTRYHRRGCKSLKGNVLEMTIDEALEKNISACGWCKPRE